jgi:hypothetical protein
VIVFRNPGAAFHALLHYTPKVSVALVIRADIRALIDSTYRVIARSRLLIEESKKLVNKSQKIVDDETARRFEKALAQRKRKAPNPPV